MKTYEIRDPIHGFVEIDEWEWAIINHPVFQRLRRIRQLAWTDMVYPGAMHTRFEHSLGVMHVATKMFDSIVKKRSEFLEKEISFTKYGLKRDRVFVRLASLLHDVGHSPFSHSGEGLMGMKDADNAYEHEDYSAAIALHLMKDVIEDHPINKRNYNITAKDISDFINKRPELGSRLLWRDLVSGQMDADRADYLLRDSHHIGVQYGKYDLDRLINTITVVIDPETNGPTLAIEEGGIHAAEGLIIARYMMFMQVYFHHTRRIFDFHIGEALRDILPKAYKGVFPLPTSDGNLKKYTKLDDWFVLGAIHHGGGGRHGSILLERDHDRCVFETPEVPLPQDLSLFDEINSELGDKVTFIDSSEKSWYKFKKDDVHILKNNNETGHLSEFSSVVKGLKSVMTKRIYVKKEEKETAKAIVDKIRLKQKNGEV